RYHKVIVMCDADVDGAHIRTLVLTFLFREMPELIEAGYVYLAKAPLYKVKSGKNDLYIEKESELEEFLLRDKLERMEVGDRVDAVPAPLDVRVDRLPQLRACPLRAEVDGRDTAVQRHARQEGGQGGALVRGAADGRAGRREGGGPAEPLQGARRDELRPALR